MTQHKRQGKAGKQQRRLRALRRLEADEHPDLRIRGEIKVLRERLGENHGNN